MAHADAAFTDSIPEIYERLLFPLLFAPYPAAIVEQARAIGRRRVLEIPADTGIVTRFVERPDEKRDGDWPGHLRVGHATGIQPEGHSTDSAAE
jgi:hypothetical protein